MEDHNIGSYVICAVLLLLALCMLGGLAIALYRLAKEKLCSRAEKFIRLRLRWHLETINENEMALQSLLSRLGYRKCVGYIGSKATHTYSTIDSIQERISALEFNQHEQVKDKEA